jgi:hypothetical protein
MNGRERERETEDVRQRGNDGKIGTGVIRKRGEGQRRE